MEVFQDNEDLGGDVTKETKAELNTFQKEFIKQSGPEIDAIKKTIGSLKSFSDLPIKINYPAASKEKITKKEFPSKLDMWPKPLGGKRKNIDGKLVDNPDPLLICLDDRKFTITPDVGIVSDIQIINGKIILDASKLGIKLKTESYDAERMTKLLILLWTHKSGLNKDIESTPRAIVKEIK